MTAERIIEIFDTNFNSAVRNAGTVAVENALMLLKLKCKRQIAAEMKQKECEVSEN